MSIGTPAAPLAYPNPEEHRRILAIIINNALQGKLHNTDSVTLTVSADSTVVDDRRVSANSVILLMPTTANAAAALATTYITPTTFQFTIYHANNAQNDRTFSYAIFG